VIAHVAGAPVEELLVLMLPAGGALVLAQLRILGAHRRSARNSPAGLHSSVR
jgi:hypothetical protein